LPVPKTIFISFRRIRYHDASLAYRDLMFSGAVPWLSDHCISAPQVLSFIEHPEQLEPFLLETINASAYALVLVDDGYFQSAWTSREFEQILKTKLPAVIALLGGAQLPRKIARRLPGSVQVYTNLRQAIEAICQQLGTSLVSFAGQRLSWYMPDGVFGFEFGCPQWLSNDIYQGRRYSRYGDELWFRMSPVQREPAEAIVTALEDAASVDQVRVYKLFDDELWYQVRRLSRINIEGMLPVGYHKFPVQGLSSTAVALSLQLTHNAGFCRYASIVVPEQKSLFQMACFVKGSLQRFQTLIPDIDEIILTLQKGSTSRSENQDYQPKLHPESSSDFVWARCLNCKKRAELTELATGQCSVCSSTTLECMSVQCTARKQMSYAALQKEAERERKDAQRGVSHQSVYDTGVLCESCLSSLYIPGEMIARLNEQPEQGMPLVWGPRTALLVSWLCFCAFGVVWGGGFIFGWALGTIALITLVEPYGRGASTDPISSLNKRLHLINLLPFVLCLLWFLASRAEPGNQLFAPRLALYRSSVPLALAGSLVTLSLGLRGLGIATRFREAHFIYGAVWASLYSLLLTWKLNALEATGGTFLALLPLAIALSTAVASIAFLYFHKLTGTFSPAPLWELMKNDAQRPT
jgi:hypothetical protein